MLTPKGKVKKIIKPPYHTYISGIGNKAEEYNGEIFLNRGSGQLSSVAKFNADSLPEETILTYEFPTTEIATPNEYAGWTLTKMTGGIFAVSGMGGKGITKVSDSLAVISETSLAFDIWYAGQQLHPSIMSQVYWENYDLIVSATNFNGAIYGYPNINFMLANGTTPTQGTSSVHLVPANAPAYHGAYCPYLNTLGNKLYATDWDTKQTYVLDNTLAITDTIPDLLYMMESTGDGYYVSNPLVGTIIDVPTVTTATIFKKDSLGNILLSTTLDNCFINTIAQDYAGIEYISVCVATSFPLYTADISFKLLSKATLEVLAEFPLVIAPTSVALMTVVRNGCMDSRGYSFFPLAMARDYNDGRIYRVPPVPVVPSQTYSILLHFDTYPFANAGTVPATITSAPQQLYTDTPIFGAGSLLGNRGTSNGDYVATLITPVTPPMTLPAWTIRFKFKVRNAAMGYLGFFLGWNNSFINVTIHTGGSIVVKQFSPAIGATILYNTVQEFSLELFNGNLYIYIDGSLIGSEPYTDPFTSLPIPSMPVGQMTLGDQGNASVDGTQTVFDEFIFLNGTSLAAGSSTYSIQTSPYLP